MIGKSVKRIALSVALLLGLATTASAVTVGFGSEEGTYTPYTEAGFQVSNANLVNSRGNCPLSEMACLRLGGRGENAVYSFDLTRTNGGTFDLIDFAFRFTGEGNRSHTLTLMAAGLADIVIEVGSGGIATDVDYMSVSSLFEGVNAVTFVYSGPRLGLLRLDNISLQAVPLPASGLLLLAGLAALGLRRRKQVKA